MRPIDGDALKEKIIGGFGKNTDTHEIVRSGILDALNVIDAQEEIKLPDLMMYVSEIRQKMTVGDATATASISDMVDTFEAIPTKYSYKCPGCGKRIHLCSERLLSRIMYIDDNIQYVAQCECICGWSTPCGYGKTRKKAIKKGIKLAGRCAKKWGSKK